MLEFLRVMNPAKSRRKILVYGVFIFWFVCLNIWVYHYNSNSKFRSISDDDVERQMNEKGIHGDVTIVWKDVDVLNLLPVKLYKKYKLIDDIKEIEGHSTIYEKMLKKHNMEGVMNDLSFQERCDLYFNTLFQDDINWSIDPKRDLPLENRFEFKYQDFRRKEMNSVKEQYAKDNDMKKDDVKDEMVEDKMKEKYEKFWEKTMKTEQIIIDYVSHLRIFNKCFITSDNDWETNANNKFISEQREFMHMIDANRHFKPSNDLLHLNTDSFSSCSTLESRLYPWLSFNYPTYIRWTGEKHFQPPKLSKFVRHKEVFEVNGKLGKGKGSKPHSRLTNNKACFLNEFKNSLNGRGIVMSIGDGHVDDAVRLIYLLRALNNKYPIQIVYYDGLSQKSMDKITHAAREQFSSLPKSFEKVKDFFPKNYLSAADHGLVKQEIWFVNVRNAIHENYKSKFEKFSNKFLATFFNSFEEFILLDADTVLLQSPEYFFNLKGYKEKGAYFYKDRTSLEARPRSDLQFFKKISPSVIDTTLFNFPVLTEKTLNLEFFQGNSHFMESGLVVINRNLHYNSILMMLLLNIMTPARERVYGDKEIFWLGFAINGDEEFQMNKYGAAAIGEVTPPADILKSDGTERKTKEICAAHPGHISGEDGKTLVWFNSGFMFCGQEDKVDFEKEFNQKTRYKFLTSVDHMKTFYRDPLVLKAAIVPPFINRERHENIDEEPVEGWKMEKLYCNGYLWCAFSSIGGKTRDGGDNTLKGKYIEFDKTTTSLFSYLGDMWMGYD